MNETELKNVQLEHARFLVKSYLAHFYDYASGNTTPDYDKIINGDDDLLLTYLKSFQDICNKGIQVIEERK